MSKPRFNQMLESKDRDYLDGELNYPNSESKSRRERELTDRVYGALDDFRFLQRKIQGRVWEKLRDPDPTHPVDARDGMVAAMALFYEIHQTNNWDFEDTLRRALEGAYSYGSARRDLPRRTVDDVEFEATTHSGLNPGEVKQRVRRKLENGEDLTDYEIAEAVRAGGLDTTRWLGEYLRDQQRERGREEWLERVRQDIETLHDNEE